MYLQKIKNKITGYVFFRAEGYYIEKFINICRSKGFFLCNLKRKNDTIIEANIPVGEFFEICKIAKTSKCRIKIISKKGLPFVLNRYRKRKIFAISLLAVMAVLITLSKFVWNIEVIGNVEISSDDILKIAKCEGLEIGKLKNKVNAKEIAERIRAEREDISWVRG